MSIKNTAIGRKHDTPDDVGGYVFNDFPFDYYKNVNFGASFFDEIVFTNELNQRELHSSIVKDCHSEIDFSPQNAKYQLVNLTINYRNTEISQIKKLTENIKYISLNEKYNENKIKERLKFLDNELFGTENEERYKKTKVLLIKILRAIEYEKYPFIGVDDDGQIGAEWHDGLDYKIVSITPLDKEKIIINCVKSIESIVNIQTTLNNIRKNSNRELRINI
jgi:hypothetical protein